MTQRFAVVYESAADFETATEIADRVLVDRIPWLDDSLLDSQRQWLAADASSAPLTWTSIAQRARDAGIVARGHFDGKPGLPDASAARRAILYVQYATAEPNAVMLIRDVDNQPERRRGLEQGRKAVAKSIPVVIGGANPKREAWILCGFDAQNDTESELLDEQRKALGFDPRTNSHQLTATGDHDKRSAKRVLTALTSNDRDRQCRCWQVTRLDLLMERGIENGLADYCQEIGTILAPLIGNCE